MTNKDYIYLYLHHDNHKLQTCCVWSVSGNFSALEFKSTDYTHTHTCTHRHAHMRTHSFAVLLWPSLFQLNQPIPEAVNAILMDGDSLGNKCQFWKENKSWYKISKYHSKFQVISSNELTMVLIKTFTLIWMGPLSESFCIDAVFSLFKSPLGLPRWTWS